LTGDLQQVSHALAGAAYGQAKAAAAGAGAGASGGHAPAGGAGGEDVIDAEYTTRG
jgi:molecular chaperone DnaK